MKPFMIMTAAAFVCVAMPDASEARSCHHDDHYHRGHHYYDGGIHIRL